MRSPHWVTVAALVIVAMFSAASAQAQVVTFKAVKDAVPGKFFDAAKSTIDPLNHNRLRIGFDSGFDPVTLIANDFRASALAFSNRTATDTISVTLKAPAGFYIATVTYTQIGTGSTGRTDITRGATMGFVASTPYVFGTFTNNPNLTRTIDIRASRLTSVPVVVTTSLFSQTGTVAVTAANLLVTLLPF